MQHTSVAATHVDPHNCGVGEKHTFALPLPLPLPLLPPVDVCIGILVGILVGL